VFKSVQNFERRAKVLQTVISSKDFNHFE